MNPGASAAPTPRAAPAVVPQVDVRQKMAAVAQQLRDYLRSNGRDLEFRVDADTDAMVITVREAASGKVVRQIPTEEALQMRHYLDEWSGTFLDVTA
jgi:flagellar protein FlaG